MKFCPSCKTTKPITNFNKNKGRKDGRASECSQCSRIRGAEWKRNNPEKVKTTNRRVQLLQYNLSLDAYDVLSLFQDQRCAICKARASDLLETTGLSRLHVDHDHKTGKVRGLLCNTCNTGIGLLKESPLLMQEAINYLLNPNVDLDKILNTYPILNEKAKSK